LIFSVFKKLSLKLCLVVLCISCRAVIMWNGVVWIPEGPQVVFQYVG
jgi:hypothetical protein